MEFTFPAMLVLFKSIARFNKVQGAWISLYSCFPIIYCYFIGRILFLSIISKAFSYMNNAHSGKLSNILCKFWWDIFLFSVHFKENITQEI